MKVKLFNIVVALTALFTLHATGQTPTPPPQAVAVGFTNLVFDDEFTNADTFAPTSTPTATSKWYRYGDPETNDIAINTGTGSGATAGATGVLTVNNSPDAYNAVIQSVPGNAVGTQRAGTFQHGYFEARMQFSSTVQGTGGPNTGWPSFWLWDTRALSPFAGQLTAECDILEAWPLGTAGAADYPINTLHNWDNTATSGGTDIFNTNAENAVITPAPPTDNGWHTWGCLWVATSSTTGYVQFYLDNVLIVHQNGVSRFPTGAGSGLSAMETAYMYIILGTAQNWPLNVDWVHVWQSGTDTAQSVSNFPSTLSLSTAASPYTLPATTSAGLTISYSVVSGPATVSGNTLTLTGTGTVVLQASQAGNSTYAPLSATETITVTAPEVTQTVSNFPSTLSLSKSASPYTLPTTTSAGLTIVYSVISGPATVSGNTLTLTGTGTVVLQASQTGNATYAPFSAMETITIAVTQTVSNFPATLSLSTTESPYALPATTSAGLTLAYSVVSGPATVSGGTLTLNGAGTVVVQASQAGNATYAPFSATETINVGGTQTVSNFPPTLSLSASESTYTLPATTSAGLTITYLVGSGPAKVSDNILTLTGTGTVVVQASQAGNDSYAAFSATETISVMTAPPQAVAVGFTNLVFDDEFTNADTFAPTSTPTATSKWYRYGDPETNDIAINTGTGSGATAGATGVLTVNNSPDAYNAVIQSVPGNAVGTQRAGTFQHGYFEARMQFSSTVQGTGGPNTGWPSFWLWDTRALSPFAGQLTAECDVMEAWPLGTAGAADYPINTLHNWDNTATSGGTDIFNTNSENKVVTPIPPTDNGWHTWGCLWVATSSTTGYVQFYLDNVLIVHQNGVSRFPTGTGSGLSAMETAYMYIILGTAKNWPLNVDWVHVWQSGTGTGTVAQTVSNFPATLSLSKSVSPYALPTATSSGLTISYSVVSGPATVSGNTLTLTGTGTVVLQASEMGNTTYAPFSATEKITVTKTKK